jgi:hypothetical protein
VDRLPGLTGAIERLDQHVEGLETEHRVPERGPHDLVDRRGQLAVVEEPAGTGTVVATRQRLNVDRSG